MNRNEETQRLFFQLLANKTGSTKRLIEILKSEIGLSKSAAYRRINSESLMSFSEIIDLSKKFDISLDQFAGNQQQTGFLAQLPFMDQPVKQFKDYLQPILNNLNEAKKLSNVSISFISREIPLFHYFNFPELSAFKAYLWGRMMWNFPEFQEKQFTLKEIRGITNLRKSIVKSYYKIPGIEIWSNNNIEITINQINYYLDNGMFKNPEEALILCQQLSQLMEHLYSMAYHGKKFEYGKKPYKSSPDFSLFQSLVTPTSNFIIVNSTELHKAYVNIDNLHPICTNNDSFILFMNNWKDTLQKHSDEITIKSEQSRVRFFNEAQNRLKKFESQVKKKIMDK